MVNTGHPSRGCDQCKARHTKCDEKRPRCSRCKKAGRECTGYKSDFDIKLRDETSRVSCRMRAREDSSRSLRVALPVPYEQQGVGLFVENFVLDVPGPQSPKGFLASLLPLLRTAKSDSLISGTVDAVGLCFLARTATNQWIASQAARSYVRSLNLLQKALRHDTDCISTETMISICLMGLYEIIMPPEQTVHPWLAHLQGLTAIIKARNQRTRISSGGIGFYDTPKHPSEKSALAVDYDAPVSESGIDRSDLTTRIFNGKGIPGDVPYRDQGTSCQAVVTTLDDMILRTLPIFQIAPSLLESSDPSSRANVEHLLAAARSQLPSFREWPSTMPDSWQPKTIDAKNIDSFEVSHLDIFPGRVDVYPSLFIAAVWNTYRTTLLRLYDVIAQCFQYLDTDANPFLETEELQALQTYAKETGEGICSSVAYHINNEWVSRLAATASLPGNQSRSPKAVGGLFLIWPLYGGSVLSIVPKVHRAWMRRKLRMIGISMALSQATVLADTVDLGRKTDPWKPLIISQGNKFLWSVGMF